MPYLDRGTKLCRPMEVKELKRGDVVLATPSTIITTQGSITFPPLSEVGSECPHTALTISWIDGVFWREEYVVVTNGRETTEGEINVLDPRLIPAYAFKNMMGKIRLRTSSIPGVPLVKVGETALLSFYENKIVVATHELMPLMKLLSAAILYYFLDLDQSMVEGA